jgi:hypothetical protein
MDTTPPAPTRPTHPQPGKLTDEELGKIGLQAANHTNHQTNFYQAFARAVREAVERQQGEEIARLTARSAGQLSEIAILHDLLDVAETELAARLTAKFDACDQARKNACDDRDAARAELSTLDDTREPL